MLGRRLSLGNYLGIGLYVHWTFALLVIYVAISARQDGPWGIFFCVSRLLGVFLCVTLHEYGHALAARRFGIPTLDITLLPIGGVARLERMPRIPWQELIVAVAGPAVNVVIAAALWIGFFIWGPRELIDALTVQPYSQVTAELVAILLIDPSLLGFAWTMLIVNMMLVLFNMIPAFPMDGGRVFRSVLAMMIDYRQATNLASRVGLVCAALMAGYSVYWGLLIPGLIAVFIGYAGMAEARQVNVMESVRGLMVSDAMVRCPASLFMDMPVPEIARTWRTTSLAALPVLSMGDTVVGMLTLRQFAKAIEDNVDPRTTAGQLADHNVPVVHEASSLEDMLVSIGSQHRQLPVVDSFGQLSGVLDLDTITARGALTGITPAPLPSEASFDAIR